jgi:hypothetical protein
MKNCDDDGGGCGVSAVGYDVDYDDESDGVWTKSVLSLNLSSWMNVVVVSLCLWAIGKKENLLFQIL